MGFENSIDRLPSGQIETEGNEFLAFQRGDRYALAISQRVSRRTDQNQLVFPTAFDDYAAMACRVGDETEIGCSFGYLLIYLGRAQIFYLNLDCRKRFLKKLQIAR